MKKLLMATATAITCLSAPASAQMYLGAGVGEANTDNNDTSWKLYGGYQFNPTWGIELGYNDLGSYRGSAIETWSLAATGTLPLGTDWLLLGKVGAASNQPHFGSEPRHTDLLVGIGVGYNLQKNVALRLEYEDFGKLSDGSGNNSRGSNVGLSMKYSF